MRKRVFVIGAGMSTECGAPVISQFLQPPFTNLVRGRKLSLVQKFISSAYLESATPNIEEVLSLVDHAIAKREPVAGYNSQELQEVRGALIYVISEILAKIWDRLNRDLGSDQLPYDDIDAMIISKKYGRQGMGIEKTIKEFESIVDKMRGSAWGIKKFTSGVKGLLDTYGLLSYILHSEDTVMTLNYDLFLDLALSMPYFKWDIDYGTDFLELVPEHEAAPLLYAHRPISGIEKKVITVLRLHGALNWAVCSSCKTMIATALTPLSRINQYIREFQNYSLDFRKKYLCCPDFSLEPLIVPPTWMKDYDNRYLSDIWNVAIRHLAEANIIVFLGYSFSESDYQIRSLFNRALHMRSGMPWDKIIVVNKSIDDVLPTYKRFFGKVEYFKGKTSEYLYKIVRN